jgi:hypothetical protein
MLTEREYVRRFAQKEVIVTTNQSIAYMSGMFYKRRLGLLRRACSDAGPFDFARPSGTKMVG